MRIYTISGVISAATAAKELAYLQPAADQTMIILAAHVGGEGLQTVDTWEIAFQRTSAVGPLVGAQTPVPMLKDPGDEVAGGTYRIDVTTPATVVALDYHWRKGVTNLGQGYNERRTVEGGLVIPGSGVGVHLDMVQKGTADAVDLVVNIEFGIIG